MKWAYAFFLIGIVAFCAVLLVNFYVKPDLSPDSWSYFELSKTIFSDFYRFSTIRSYENASSYSASFPPLWPFVIAIFNLLFDLGPRAGFAINILIVPLIAISLESLSFKLFRLKYLGTTALLICLSDETFLDEVMSGRAIPLQILILLNLFRSLFDLQKDNATSGFIRSGMLLGFCLLNRFDALVIAPIVFAYILFLKPKVKQAFIFTLCFFASISSWILYSLTHFGSIWKTDNSFVAKAVPKTYVTDWYVAPLPTIKDDFWGWYERVRSNAYPLYFNYVKGIESMNYGYLIASAIFFLLFFVSFLRREKGCLPIKKTDLISFTRFSFFLFAFGLTTLVPNLLTGYFDIRYFAFQRMLLIIIIFGVLCRALSLKLDVSKVLAQSTFLSVPCLFAVAFYKLPAYPNSSASDALYPAWIPEFKECALKQENLSAVFFFDNYSPFQAGAISGIKSGHIPENFKDLSTEERKLFFRSFGFSHILSDRTQKDIESELGLKVEHADCPINLYRLYVSSIAEES